MFIELFEGFNEFRGEFLISLVHKDTDFDDDLLVFDVEFALSDGGDDL